MDGEIWVEPNVKVGSIFCFTAVFGINIGSNTDAINEISQNDRSSKAGKESRVLLVVEDDEISRQVIVEFLKMKKFKTLVAENGQQAIEIFKNTEVDMILMDIQMPILDGFSATREIRIFEKQKNKHTPIIAMTAYALAGDNERCIQMGMDGYISKPVNFNKIYELIEKYLKV